MKSNNYDLFFSFEKMLVFNQKDLNLNSNEVNLLITIYHFDRSLNNFNSLYDVTNMSKEEFDKTLLDLSKKGLIHTDTSIDSNISLTKLVNLMKEDIINKLISSASHQYFSKLESIIKEKIMPEEEKVFFKLLSGKENAQVIALINKTLSSNKKILNFNSFIDELKIITDANKVLNEKNNSIEYNWLS